MPEDDDSEISALKNQLTETIARANTLASRLEGYEAQFSASIATIDAKSTEATESVANIKASKTTAEETTTSIAGLKNTANTDSQVVKVLSEESILLSATVESERTALENLTIEANDIKNIIENLLPGATSAGLSSAFRERKLSFTNPKRIWGTVFVVSMVALLLVAFINPISFEVENTINHESVFSYIFVRIPFIIPIVWMAIYAGRRHSQALRLEEDYAHKEVLSKSFEGYKTQLLEIDVADKVNKTTLEHISNTLNALALHPGRIYQGKHEDISPWSSFMRMFKQENKKSSEDETKN